MSPHNITENNDKINQSKIIAGQDCNGAKNIMGDKNGVATITKEKC